MGKSTFEMAVTLMKWLPLWMVDKILLVLAWLVLGNLERYDIRRPRMGPLELKNKEGKTPVLDIGALGKIRSGDINVVPGIRRFFRGKVEFVDGRSMDVDAVILATGYRSNVSSWLQVGAISFSLSLSPSVHPPISVSLFGKGKGTCNLRSSRFSIFLSLLHPS